MEACGAIHKLPQFHCVCSMCFFLPCIHCVFFCVCLCRFSREVSCLSTLSRPTSTYTTPTHTHTQFLFSHTSLRPPNRGQCRQVFVSFSPSFSLIHVWPVFVLVDLSLCMPPSPESSPGTLWHNITSSPSLSSPLSFSLPYLVQTSPMLLGHLGWHSPSFCPEFLVVLLWLFLNIFCEVHSVLCCSACHHAMVEPQVGCL